MPSLAIVPASAEQVWGGDPHTGPTPARAAYTDPLFRLATRWAEQNADRWVVLSARYGFLDPDEMVPGPDDVGFDRPDDPLCQSPLRLQDGMRERGLNGYTPVLALGDRRFVRLVQMVYGGGMYHGEVEAPLQDHPTDKSRSRWLKRQLDR